MVEGISGVGGPAPIQGPDNGGEDYLLSLINRLLSELSTFPKLTEELKKHPKQYVKLTTAWFKKHEFVLNSCIKGIQEWMNNHPNSPYTSLAGHILEDFKNLKNLSTGKEGDSFAVPEGIFQSYHRVVDQLKNLKGKLT